MTKTLYKLTRPNLTTYNGYQWVQGETRKFPGVGPLCSSGWAHAYESPDLAVLLNPIHANYNPFLLWIARGVVGATDRGLKVGCSELTLIETIEPPSFSVVQKAVFGILCAKQVFHDKKWNNWADSYILGRDRSVYAANAAHAPYYAASAATSAAIYAADAASAATSAAIYAADAATSAATSAAYDAATSAANAAHAAAYAATYAASAAHRIDFIAITSQLRAIK